MLHNGKQAIVVDPSDATPVINTLQKYQLELVAILVTHHHADHVGGIEALRPYLVQGDVWGPATEAIPQPFQPLHEGDPLSLLGLTISVLDVPGHTAGHIAYYIAEQALPPLNGSSRDPDTEMFAPVVFTGDTLFCAGCGRMFEGTASQMLASLDKLAGLPPETRVYCGHEYTLSNLRFAQAVEPQNLAIAAHKERCEKLRKDGLMTLPSQIELELCINPFLRTRESSVIKAVRAYDPVAANQTADKKADEISIFATLRRWKDHFK